MGEAKKGRHDDLYWHGAARNSTACGDDLGRLRHLEDEPYGVETHVSRLEQLVLAEVRTHYVSYKVRRVRHLWRQRNCVPLLIKCHPLGHRSKPTSTTRSGAACRATVGVA